tara:strand:+ start:1160 stop:2923 length:1764 start_codon:yes stop_codon:yes gene_type:complete
MQNKSVEIIAEIANAHQGSREIAIKIAKEAIKSGADAIKFQMYTADDLLVSTHNRYEHFKKQSFSNSDWDVIFRAIKNCEAKIYVDVFGLDSFKISQNYKIDAYKVHFSDLTNIPLLKLVALSGKDILIGSGGASFREIKNSIEIIKKHSKDSQKIILFHGFQAYPTKVSDTNLKRLRKFHELFGDRVQLGISDHIAGDSIFSKVIPAMALPYKIKFVEKHVTINRYEKGTDYYSSLEMSNFKSFIDFFRLAESSLGSQYDYPPSELNYRKKVKKKWFAKKNISKGSIITEDDIIMKRDDSSILSLDFEQIINKEAIENIAKDQIIKNTAFNHYVLGIVVARSKSSRLPDKATKEIAGEPSLIHLFKRLEISIKKSYIDEIAFCTTTEKEDDQLVELLKDFPVNVYRGDVNNVLKRMSKAFYSAPNADIILRITGDDILIDPDYVQKIVQYHLSNNLDYTDAKSLPSGTEVEVINVSVLDTILKKSENPEGTEYLTNYIVENQLLFKIGSLPVPDKHNKDYRLTLDTEDDYNLINELCTWLLNKNKTYEYTMDDIVDFFDQHPEAAKKNKSIVQRQIPSNFSTKLKI